MNTHRTLFRSPSGAFYTISSGKVWRWDLGEKGWFRSQIICLPAEAQYVGYPKTIPAELLLSIKAAGGFLHRYDFHKGQEHVTV